LTEGRGGAGVTLFACGSARSMRLDVEAFARPGPYAVELRKSNAAPAVLVAHPWAASRLLALLDGGSENVSASAAENAVHIALDSNTRTTIPFDIPAKSCVEVIATLDRVGSGLDLRLADATTGENTVARGRFFVMERRCAAADAPAKAIAEFRLSSGKADALVLTRILSD
jgi:hypothetical protein